MDSVEDTIQSHLSTPHRRDTSSPSSMSPTILSLLIALVTLLCLTILLIGALITFRRIRRNRAIDSQKLPTHNKPNLSKHRRDRLTVTTTPYGRTSTLYLYDEKTPMTDKEAQSPPPSPDTVPEIRITFPDEQDESGRRKSGRVVVVRVGDTGVGLEPLREEEQLPAYEREGKWHSIDMDSIGGLYEKPNRA